MRRALVLSMLSTVAGLAVACGEEAPATPPPPTGTAEPTAPAESVLEPLPEPHVDMTKVLLGRRLFFETRLSGDGTLSCASCHSLDHGGAEARPTSLGIGGAVGWRRSRAMTTESAGGADLLRGQQHQGAPEQHECQR